MPYGQYDGAKHARSLYWESQYRSRARSRDLSSSVLRMLVLVLELKDAKIKFTSVVVHGTPVLVLLRGRPGNPVSTGAVCVTAGQLAFVLGIERKSRWT